MARHQSPEQFAADLLQAAAAAPVKAKAVVKRAAQNVKDEGRANALKSAPVRHARAPYAITYDDPTVAGSRVSSEVGYDKDLPGGALGNLLEFGGGGDHSPAHLDLNRAADNEEDRFAGALQTMAMRLL